MEIQAILSSKAYVVPIIMVTLGAFAYLFALSSLKNTRCAFAFLFMLLGLALMSISNIPYLEAKIGELYPFPVAWIANLRILELAHLIGTACSFSSLLYLLSIVMPRHARDILARNKYQQDLLQKYRQVRDDTDRKNQYVNDLNTEIDTLLQQQYSQEKSDSNNITLYRTIFDKSSMFYVALNEQYRITDINKFACKKLDYSFGDLVNYRFLDLVDPHDRHRIQTLLEQIDTENPNTSKFDTRLRDQKRKAISIVVEPHIIDKNGNKALYLFCQDVSESKKLSEELSYQATHDDLTQLMNRRALEAYFEEHFSTPEAIQRVNLVYIDMDQFKVVNDTCGHTAGDQLLKQIVSILSNVCNENHVSVFSRIGGDEFAIALTDMDIDQSLLIAETLRNVIEDFTFVWENKSFRQSISVGLAISGQQCRSFNELLSSADAACYSAKENGRNQVKMQNVSNKDTALDHRSGMLWVSRIEKAMQNGSFSLNFQPIVKLNQPYDSYIHYEVLLQYTDENGYITPPGHFLPSAERFGKSTDLDLWVMTETFDFLRRNPEHTRLLSCCSINLTSHSIANDRSRSAIISLAEQHDFPASKICFEITETSAISNLPEAIEFIAKLRSLGCRFALDDFGTGFSSFGYLKNLDVDYLKIDGSFVRDIVDDKIDKVMIRAISEIAKEMGIKTVAEYVENERILRELKKINVDLGQGFGIAKPMPIDAVHEFYHYNPKPASL